MQKVNSVDIQEESNTYESFYTFEVIFSVTVCILLWNLTILMQIKFGDKMVTHLSEWPYLVSLSLLLVMIVEFIALEYVANI